MLQGWGDCFTAAVSHLAPRMSVTYRNKLKEEWEQGITEKADLVPQGFKSN